MSRSALRRLHLGASMVALVSVAVFLAATVITEIAGGHAAVQTVKFLIARAVVVLALAMIASAASGRRLAGRSRAPVVARKLRRMRLIAVTGLLVLIPCAVSLDQLASRGLFGVPFAVLQGIELLAGASNLTMLILNARDGMSLRARRRQVRPRPLTLAREHHR